MLANQIKFTLNTPCVMNPAPLESNNLENKEEQLFTYVNVEIRQIVTENGK